MKSDCGHFVVFLQQLCHTRRDHDDDHARNDCGDRLFLHDHDDDRERNDCGDRSFLRRQLCHGLSHSRDDDRGHDSV